VRIRRPCGKYKSTTRRTDNGERQGQRHQPFSRLLAAALLSAFFSADVGVDFGSQLPCIPAFLPATRLNPGQQAGPLLVLRLDFFRVVFFAAVFAVAIQC
jgi:hypothetical protein